MFFHASKEFSSMVSLQINSVTLSDSKHKYWTLNYKYLKPQKVLVRILVSCWKEHTRAHQNPSKHISFRKSTSGNSMIEKSDSYKDKQHVVAKFCLWALNYLTWAIKYIYNNIRSKYRISSKCLIKSSLIKLFAVTLTV